MASITITTTTAQDQRLGPAFGDKLRLDGNANAAQVKAWIIDQLRQVVDDYENRQAVAAIPPPAAFDPS